MEIKEDCLLCAYYESQGQGTGRLVNRQAIDLLKCESGYFFNIGVRPKSCIEDINKNLSLRTLYPEYKMSISMEGGSPDIYQKDELITQKESSL